MAKVMMAIKGLGLATVIAVAAVPSASSATTSISLSESLRSSNGAAFTVTAKPRARETCPSQPPWPRSRAGDGGPAVVPGKVAESLLLEMISGDKPAMPRRKRRSLK